MNLVQLAESLLIMNLTFGVVTRSVTNVAGLAVMNQKQITIHGLVIVNINITGLVTIVLKHQLP